MLMGYREFHPTLRRSPKSQSHETRETGIDPDLTKKRRQ